MAAQRPRRVLVKIDILPFSSPAIDIDLIPCSSCQTALDIHQPSMLKPEKLLGTCESCGLWFAIFLEPDRSRVLRLLLPDCDGFEPTASSPSGS